MLDDFTKSKSRRFRAVAICFILGVAIASLLNFRWGSFFYLSIGLIIIVFFLILFWQSLKFRLICLALIWLVIGILRVVIAEPSLALALGAYNLRLYQGRLAELKGIVISNQGYHEKQKIIIKTKSLRNILAKENKEVRINDKIYISTNAYPKYNYGDEVKVRCVLEEAEPKRYFAKFGVWTVCQSAKIELLAKHQGNFIFANIIALRAYLNELIVKILPEPSASLLAGLLIGAQSNFDSSLRIAFNRTGLAHIVAVSGYNVTLIAAAFIILAKKLKMPSRGAFWLATGGLAGFVCLSGLAAATLRAALMGWLLLFAKQEGRSGGSLDQTKTLQRIKFDNLFIFAAALMLAFNPFYLFDISWQLSFLAIWGLVYLAPLFDQVLEKIFKRLKLNWQKFDEWGAREIISSTLAAISATSPLIIYQFKQVSTLAPLVNLLVLPLIPLAMFLGAGVVTLAIFWLPLAKIFSWLLWITLNFMIEIARFFSSFSFAAIDLPQLPWWLVFLSYAIMVRVAVSHPERKLKNQV